MPNGVAEEDAEDDEEGYNEAHHYQPREEDSGSKPPEGGRRFGKRLRGGEMWEPREKADGRGCRGEASRCSHLNTGK